MGQIRGSYREGGPTPAETPLQRKGEEKAKDNKEPGRPQRCEGQQRKRSREKEAGRPGNSGYVMAECTVKHHCIQRELVAAIQKFTTFPKDNEPKEVPRTHQHQNNSTTFSSSSKASAKSFIETETSLIKALGCRIPQALNTGFVLMKGIHQALYFVGRTHQHRERAPVDGVQTPLLNQLLMKDGQLYKNDFDAAPSRQTQLWHCQQSITSGPILRKSAAFKWHVFLRLLILSEGTLKTCTQLYAMCSLLGTAPTSRTTPSPLRQQFSHLTDSRTSLISAWLSNSTANSIPISHYNMIARRLNRHWRIHRLNILSASIHQMVVQTHSIHGLIHHRSNHHHSIIRYFACPIRLTSQTSTP